ncbi:PQQ-binding-like beta-propeller repeat protein [Streptosporangium amethystogenes subsp. fukuiense]|uniref:PQQ-binding-like beta-propeller repeat protein n=1 Tax=Streptosporangium amethystogenes subsp. fukuiense TaxID=698418 RepID=A0ABW2SSV7_9ACTN
MIGYVVDHLGRPRAGVTLSDGITLTTTSADGRFHIVPQGPFVFLTRPAGWTCAPWFVPATAAEVTFTLTPDNQPDLYRFVHISDTHISTDNGARLYQEPVEMGSRDGLAEFLRSLPERVPGLHSVIATGDLTDSGVDAEYEALRLAVHDSPVPVHLLPGNHDHMAGRHGFETSRNNYLINTGDPSGYERNVGPRWYSFDLPGLHVAALDWHTHELGLDHELQDAWLRADLESLAAGTPWILLSHDQPGLSILEGLPHQPLATFSGHWHTSRVIEVGGTLHVNTPTPLFAGLDYSPPSYRVVTWDGERITLETRAVAPAGLERSTFSAPIHAVAVPRPVRWRHQLPGPGQRAAVRVAEDLVLSAVVDEDRAAGGVDAIDLACGSLRWRTALRSAVKGTPAVHADVVIAVEVSGDVVGLDLADGTERWRTTSPDPLRRFAFTPPVVAGDLVIVGDLAHLRALDARTGEPRWERVDLAPHINLVGNAAPVVSGDLVHVGSLGVPPTMICLEVDTGATVWPTGYSTASLADRLRQGASPVGTPLLDKGDLYIPTSKGVVKVDGGSGEVLWQVRNRRGFVPTTPVAVPHGIAVVDGGTDLVLLNRRDGAEIWRTTFQAAGPFSMTSYAVTPHPVFASPSQVTVDGTELLLVPGLDGRIHVVIAQTGERRDDIELDVPIAASLAVTGDTLLAVGVDGGVLAIDRRVLG